MADIIMSLDDTLELDTIIKESNIASDPIEDVKYNGSSTNEYDSDNIQTHTSIFKPRKSGTYDIFVNGQKLTIEVTDPNTIPDPYIHLTFENSNLSDKKDNATFSVSNGTEKYTTDTTLNSVVMDATSSRFSARSFSSFIKSMNDTDKWTFSFWYKRKQLIKNDRLMGFSTEENGNAGGFIFYDFSVSNKQNNPYFAQNGNSIMEFNPANNYDTWNHLAVTCDGSGNVKGFLNGKQKSSGSISSTSDNPDGFAVNGAGEDISENMDGFVDDVLIYLEELPESKISEIYEATKP